MPTCEISNLNHSGKEKQTYSPLATSAKREQVASNAVTNLENDSRLSTANFLQQRFGLVVASALLHLPSGQRFLVMMP
jgi:hypothetical protein